MEQVLLWPRKEPQKRAIMPVAVSPKTEPIGAHKLPTFHDLSDGGERSTAVARIVGFAPREAASRQSIG